METILFSMFYSILVGEEPDSVLVKKEGKQNQADSWQLGFRLIIINLILTRRSSPDPLFDRSSDVFILAD
ncbi:hypothetical protein IHE45_16G072600, partial [Dioscorea alata]